ncbi:MAG: hypothetical protein BWY66_00876 [bacterium ADurb.Bin374]|nr:MAG: hypothetical protein BWY66_00876 [bacterium ADurb.Bin374]
MSVTPWVMITRYERFASSTPTGVSIARFWPLRYWIFAGTGPKSSSTRKVNSFRVSGRTSWLKATVTGWLRLVTTAPLCGDMPTSFSGIAACMAMPP